MVIANCLPNPFPANYTVHVRLARCLLAPLRAVAQPNPQPSVGSLARMPISAPIGCVSCMVLVNTTVSFVGDVRAFFRRFRSHHRVWGSPSSLSHPTHPFTRFISKPKEMGYVHPISARTATTCVES